MCWKRRDSVWKRPKSHRFGHNCHARRPPGATVPIVARLKKLDDAPYLDLMSAEYLDDPEGTVDRLRQESWVVRGIIGGMVIDRKHVQLLLADRRLCSSVTAFIEMQGVTEGILHDPICATLLAIEGADHTRVRTLVRQAFVPAAVDRHRPLMRSILESLLAPVATSGQFGFRSVVAERCPIQVMCHILGVPTDDHEVFPRGIKAIAWTLSLDLAAH